MGVLQDLVAEPRAFTGPRPLSDLEVADILTFAQERYDEGWPVHTFTLRSNKWIGSDPQPLDFDLAPVIAWVEKVASTGSGKTG